MTRAVAVDIVLCVHNGARFIAEQIWSIQSQTHQDWRLWIRDDGSSDDSLKVVEQIAGKDDRIHVFPPDGQRLGAGPGFGWLLEQLSGESRYVFFSDADDVWMPEKMEQSLAAMLRAESHPGPVLVHTDLVVADERLQTIRDSLWRHLRISPEPVSLCRLLAHNVVTGPTMLINRPLLDLARPIPEGAVYQDTWIALVASAFGRTVALHEPTVLYRRHESNSTGRDRGGPWSPSRMAGMVIRTRSRGEEIRRSIQTTARQAEAFLLQYGPLLSTEDQRLLREYSEIPGLRFLPRKLRVLRNRSLGAQGLARHAAFLLGS